MKSIRWISQSLTVAKNAAEKNAAKRFESSSSESNSGSESGSDSESSEGDNDEKDQLQSDTWDQHPDDPSSTGCKYYTDLRYYCLSLLKSNHLGLMTPHQTKMKGEQWMWCRANLGMQEIERTRESKLCNSFIFVSVSSLIACQFC